MQLQANIEYGALTWGLIHAWKVRLKWSIIAGTGVPHEVTAPNGNAGTTVIWCSWYVNVGVFCAPQPRSFDLAFAQLTLHHQQNDQIRFHRCQTRPSDDGNTYAYAYSYVCMVVTCVLYQARTQTRHMSGAPK